MYKNLKLVNIKKQSASGERRIHVNLDVKASETIDFKLIFVIRIVEKDFFLATKGKEEY